MTHYLIVGSCHIKGHRTDQTNVCNICGGTWWFMSNKTRCHICRKHKINTYFLNKTNGDKWICETCMNKQLAMSAHLFDK